MRPVPDAARGPGLRADVPARLRGADLVQGHGAGHRDPEVSAALRDEGRPGPAAQAAAQPALTPALVCVVLVLVFVADVARRPWSPKRGLGLVFGFLAALALRLRDALSRRAGRAARPLGTARGWIQAHVYLGVVAMLARPDPRRLPAGRTAAMGWWLLGALAPGRRSRGLLGVWLQKWIPAVARGRAAGRGALRAHPGARRAAASTEADALMADASDVLERFYRTEVRARAARRSQPSWSYLLDVRGGRERALEPFRRMAPFVDAAEKEKVEDLMHDLHREDGARRAVQPAGHPAPLAGAARAAGGLLMGLLVDPRLRLALVLMARKASWGTPALALHYPRCAGRILLVVPALALGARDRSALLGGPARRLAHAAVARARSSSEHATDRERAARSATSQRGARRTCAASAATTPPAPGA